jgi:hypothetical protein
MTKKIINSELEELKTENQKLKEELDSFRKNDYGTSYTKKINLINTYKRYCLENRKQEADSLFFMFLENYYDLDDDEELKLPRKGIEVVEEKNTYIFKNIDELNEKYKYYEKLNEFNQKIIEYEKNNIINPLFYPIKIPKIYISKSFFAYEKINGVSIQFLLNLISKRKNNQIIEKLTKKICKKLQDDYLTYYLCEKNNFSMENNVYEKKIIEYLDEIKNKFDIKKPIKINSKIKLISQVLNQIPTQKMMYFNPENIIIKDSEIEDYITIKKILPIETYVQIYKDKDKKQEKIIESLINELNENNINDISNFIIQNLYHINFKDSNFESDNTAELNCNNKNLFSKLQIDIKTINFLQNKLSNQINLLNQFNDNSNYYYGIDELNFLQNIKMIKKQINIENSNIKISDDLLSKEKNTKFKEAFISFYKITNKNNIDLNEIEKMNSLELNKDNFLKMINLIDNHE